MSKIIEQQVRTLAEHLLKHQWRLVTAESCTGGGLGHVLTSVAGASRWYEHGWVTYTNLSKTELLGVDSGVINQFGAVSRETALAMAEGALKHSHADISLSITGIAGPDGGTHEKPVGTVWIACAKVGAAAVAREFIFSGDREAIRAKSIEEGVRFLVYISSNSI